ncbi:MAG: AraC family transcriptional regulator [Bacteroidales bacterium]
MDYITNLSKNIDSHKDSIVILRQQIDCEAPLHEHDKGQLLLVFGGIAYLQTDTTNYYIPSNYYIWIPKSQSHRILFNAKDLNILNIYFTDEMDLSHPFYNTLGIYPVSSLLHEILNYTKEWNGHIFPETWEYELLLTMKHLLPNEKLKRFTLQLPMTKDKKMIEITHYLHSNIHEPLTLPHVAQIFGLSVRSMTRLFQQKLHISFLQYLKMLRVIHSIELMKNTEMNITEIAYNCGYSGISAFSYVFQQLTGNRPKDFQMMLSSKPNIHE